MEYSVKEQDASLLAFTDILFKLDRKFEIIHTLWSEEKSFEAKFRTEVNKNSIDYNIVCDEWVDKFSELTDTVWVKKTSNTGPKVKFRKQYQCWTHKGKVVKKELLFDARKCKGTLDMKVFSDNKPTSKKKNKFYRLGLNVVVKINFYHLHKVNTSEPLAFFVHLCEPQSDAPRQTPIINERLPQLVNDIICKGLNSSLHTCVESPSKSSAIAYSDAICQTNSIVESKEQMKDEERLVNVSIDTSAPMITVNQNNIENDSLIQGIHVHNISTLQFVQNIPLQNLNEVKLELQPGLETVCPNCSWLF